MIPKIATAFCILSIAGLSLVMAEEREGDPLPQEWSDAMAEFVDSLNAEDAAAIEELGDLIDEAIRSADIESLKKAQDAFDRVDDLLDDEDLAQLKEIMTSFGENIANLITDKAREWADDIADRSKQLGASLWKRIGNAAKELTKSDDE